MKKQTKKKLDKAIKKLLSHKVDPLKPIENKNLKKAK